jgi:hypothetical protein
MAAWKPGQSGNPKGRPKTRVLSERLRAAASKTIEVDGKPTAGSIVAARIAWEAITKGKVKFPDDAEETILSFDQWLALMKFVYGQTEGAPPAAVEVSGADGGPIAVALVDYRAGITDGDE